MEQEQKTRIIGLVKIINKTSAKEENAEILDFAVEDVASRVLIYLNRQELPLSTERIVARVVSGMFNQILNQADSTSAELAISSVSDNGQSISYANEIKKYLATADDNDLFSGFAKILAPLRRINVVA